MAESFDVVVTKKTENGPVNQPENQPVNAQEFVALRDQDELMGLIAEWAKSEASRTPRKTDEDLVREFKKLDIRLNTEDIVKKFLANDALLEQRTKKVGDIHKPENSPLAIEGGGKRKNAAQQLQQFFKNQLLKRKNKNKNGGRSRKQNKRNQKNKSSKRQRGGQQSRRQSRRQQQQRNKNKKSRRQQKKN